MTHRPDMHGPRPVSRRRVLAASSGLGAWLSLRKVLGAADPGAELTLSTRTFGAPRPDPNRVIDLPPGFSYDIISRAGDRMSDGLRVPAGQDGMAAFDRGDGRIALICNHELDMGDADLGAFTPDGARPPADRFYDGGVSVPCPGGTTTIVYNPSSRRVERQFLSLAGTERNCAGGPTPWGSWLSCEESVTSPDAQRARSHGWVFEVPASARGPVDPVPLSALGRFNHEAAAVDPRTGIVYLTEDQPDSLLYRFLPARAGELRAGGRLQALCLAEARHGDTRNWPHTPASMPEGQPFGVRWIELTDTDAPDDDLRRRGHAAGAALFARGEGLCQGGDSLYFCCTSGGRAGAGQIFRYQPSVHEGQPGETGVPGLLELFIESRDRRALANCDNIVMAPWGDLIVCEDSDAPCSLVGITPDGDIYHLAENSWTDSEFAGACFAPDGRTLFVNYQTPGMTLAIRGPFPG